MPIIQKIINKIKQGTDILVSDKTIFLVLLILLTAICSFGLGRLSKIEDNQTPLIVKNSTTTDNNLAQISQVLGGKYVASKNSDKYHAPWCSGAQRIKVDNQIWFNSKEEAELAGYTPASNCKGI